MHDASKQPERRPIASRRFRLSQQSAAWLDRAGMSPNAISVSSFLFGAGAGGLLALTGQAQGAALVLCWLGAAACIQLRLLANMLDGMVALRRKDASPVGELYNEVPDRLSDAVILIGAGYADGSMPELGYLAAVVALFVAYARAMGGVCGAGQVFAGPMAKPQRMFLLTLACVYCAAAPRSWQIPDGWDGRGILAIVLMVIIAGGVVTAWRRLAIIARRLRDGPR